MCQLITFTLLLLEKVNLLTSSLPKMERDAMEGTLEFRTGCEANGPRAGRESHNECATATAAAAIQIKGKLGAPPKKPLNHQNAKSRSSLELVIGNSALKWLFWAPFGSEVT